MRRSCAALILLSPLLSAPATARDVPPPQDPELSAPDLKLESTLLTLGILEQRLTVPVVVGDNGPYNFIIDTGAERTVVSRELAGALKLRPAKPVRLVSMSGTSTVETVKLSNLAIEALKTRHDVIAPSLAARHIGALGLLGIDTLRDHKVMIDFATNTMAVQPSRKEDRNRPAAPGEIVVTAKNLFGQLIVTDAYYENTRIQVVLDTGSQVTVGNTALRRRIGENLKTEEISLTSVTGEKSIAGYTRVPNIRIGRVNFNGMPVAFSEAAPFKRFGLTKRPAMMLGMDALASFEKVEIDFPNRQVRFHTSKDLIAKNSLDK